MTLSNNQPIGIFDSGIGGLSIINYIEKHLPNENLIYVADTLHTPYGDKPEHLILDRVNEIADKLIQKDVKAMVVACNTATVNAIDQLRNRISVPIIGVEPAIKPATLCSKNKKVGVLVTQATALNPRFLNLIEKFAFGAHVIVQPCTRLVELIEQGDIHSSQCHLLLDKYLRPLLKENVDTIVLGCTHYPFLLNKIQTICGDDINIIDTALPVTNQLKRQLQEHGILRNECKTPNIEFLSSKPSIFLDSLCTNLLNKKVSFNLF